MFANFLPAQVTQIQEKPAILLAQNIKRELIKTQLNEQAIATAYVRQGNGKPPILLLHGFDSSVLEFRHLLPLLAAHHETWAVDLLGFGFTQRLPSIDYNPNTIKIHLYAAWRTLIKQPVVLVGTSMGGATAIDFALTYPETVEKLIIINSVGFSGDFPIGKLLFPPLDFLAVEYWRQRKLQALFWSSLNQSSSIVDAIRCAALHLEMPHWNQALLDFMKSGGYGDIADRVGKVTQPTLILWGDRDDTLASGDAVKFQRAIANSQLVWLKDCGHVPQLEQPEVLAKRILAFL